jgi:hypothetical protein
MVYMLFGEHQSKIMCDQPDQAEIEILNLRMHSPLSITGPLLA